MVNARGIGRLGLLAVGLGIGAAVAATPGIASADTSLPVDPFSWIDPGDLFAASTASTPTLDMQISVNGMDLLPTTDNTATADSGMGDIAIAIGKDSFACAGCSESPGTFDFAYASGTGSAADSGFGNLDNAIATGTNSLADAGAGNFDTAIANGANSFANATGIPNSAVGNFDFASALGANTNAEAGSILTDTASSNDVAFVFDPSATLGSTALAGDGNFDLAGVLFQDGVTANATGANFLVDILPSLFGAASSAAADGNLLTDLLSLL